MHTFQAQPGKGGQEKVVQQAREDGAGNLGEHISKRPLHQLRPLPPPNLAPGAAHLILSLVYSNQEEQLRKEEVDAQVLVDGVTVGLQASQEAEGGDTDGQTDQGDDNANPGDD